MATYNVQKNGNAQAGLKAGDLVNTAGGTYKILDASKYSAMNANDRARLGVNYNPETGYYSMKVNNTTSVKSPNGANSSSGINWTVQPKPQSTGNVNTNTSYGGSYINNLNLDTDYQAGINKAVGEGDYYTAARLEAQRNAKINYLNSIGANSGNYGTTFNYIKDYSDNNQGGHAYRSKYTYQDLKNGNLPDNWTQATISGLRYKRDADGTIYNYGGPGADGKGSWTPIGNRINPNTGEWMFDNADTAREAAYANYARATGDYSPNALSPEYINRVMQGTQNQYAQQLADEQLQRELAAQVYYDKTYGPNTNDGWYQNNQGVIDIASDYINQANLTSDQKNVLHTNSFETDPTLPDDYHVYGVRNYSDPYSLYMQGAYRRSQYNRR